MSRKGIVAILNNGIEFFVGSLILIFVTKLFTIQESGAWIVFVTIVYMGTKFREGLLQSSLMKFSAGVKSDQRYNIYWVTILVGLSIEVILSYSMYLVSFLFEDDFLGVLLKSYYLLALPQSLFRLFQFIKQSELRVKSMAQANLFMLSSVVIILVFAFSNELSFKLIPGLLGFAYSLSLIYQLVTMKVWKWKSTVRKGSIPKGYVRYALNGFLRELFGTVSSRAYIFLTAGLIGYEESAMVGIASRYANLIYLPNSAYQGILYPKACTIVSKSGIKSMFLFYRRAVSWMQAAFIPYVFLLVTIGSAGIILMHGTEFLSSIPLFITLVIAGAFIAPYGNAFGSVCQAAGRPELVTQLVLINSILNLSLSYMLIQIMGVWGAIMSGICTDLIGLVLISFILRKEFSMSIFEPTTRIFRRFNTLILLMIRMFKKREVFG